jgi:replicative DNA helicase
VIPPGVDPLIAVPVLTEAQNDRDKRAVLDLTNEDAERAVLGSILLDPNAVDIAAGLLTPEDFSRQHYGRIFKCALGLRDSGVTVEQIALLGELERQGVAQTPQQVGDVIGLINAVPSVVMVEDYARQVEELAVRRRLLAAGRQVTALAQKAKDAQSALAQAQDTVSRVAQRKGTTRFNGLENIMITFYDRLAAVSQGDGPAVGIPTGFTDLDRATGGLQRGDLFLLAARPSLGKTSLALSICLHAARQGHPSAIVSLEMGQQSLANRLVSMVATVDGSRLRNGWLKDEEFQRVSKATGDLARLPIHIDDTAGLTAADMRWRVSQLQARHGTELVVLDYLQLMHGSGGKDGRTNEVGEISRACKAVARDLNVAFIAVSQLNRQVEQRAGGRPMLSDLRDSGQLEQDADVVLFLHREDSPPRPNGTQTVIGTIAKHRNGPLAEFPLDFVPELTLFRSQDRQQRAA